VVLSYLPGMGKGSAAGAASSLALVFGICGGATPPPKYEEIFLGDVVISDSVIEYDSGLPLRDATIANTHAAAAVLLLGQALAAFDFLVACTRTISILRFSLSLALPWSLKIMRT
jgi:nucleoside phosphorylase